MIKYIVKLELYKQNHQNIPHLCIEKASRTIGTNESIVYLQIYAPIMI